MARPVIVTLLGSRQTEGPVVSSRPRARRLQVTARRPLVAVRPIVGGQTEEGGARRRIVVRKKRFTARRK